LYTISLPAAPNDSTDANGMITITIDLGDGCAPSMCCPVEVEIYLAECGPGPIAASIGVLQNSHDMVAGLPPPTGSGGIVDLSDISAFTTAKANYVVGGIPQPCADWVFSAGAAVGRDHTLRHRCVHGSHQRVVFTV
jgi:hypothetical protein